MSYAENDEKMEMDKAEDAEVKGALEAFEDVKQKFNLIRSKIILLDAVHNDGSSFQQTTHVGNSDAGGSFSELEDKIDRLCIQEGAIQHALEIDTVHKIRSSGVLRSELQDLLDLNLKQEVQIVSMSSEITEEYFKLQKAQDNLSQTLEKYMIYEKEQSQQFKENSIHEDDQPLRKLRRQLKEIRFMQLIIPRIISQLDQDFTKTEWLGKLCKEIRDPILSVDDLQ